MSIQNSTIQTVPATVPGWMGISDQTSATMMAKAISALSNARTVDFEELGSILNTAVDKADGPNLSVQLDRDGFNVVTAGDANEWYHISYGTHLTHGNFAILWSVRGPGDGLRPRPCFLFCDEEAIFIGGAA